MSKELYDDKVRLRDSELAEINKWTAENANSLKGAVNNIDDRVIALETGTSNIINVSAIWTSGLSFNVTANSFPILDGYKSATGGIVTLDVADLTFGRFDFIVAYAPILPNTVGTVGKITGIPSANPADPDYDPSEVYVIKRVLIQALATEPDGVSRKTMFDEDLGTPTEFNFISNSANIIITTNNPHGLTKSIEGTNVIGSNYFNLTSDVALQTEDAGVITFWLKLKANYGVNYIGLSFSNNGISVGAVYSFGDGSNGFVANNLNWQKITIDKSQFNLPSGDFDSLRIQMYKSFLGFFIDEVELHTGSEIIAPPITHTHTNLSLLETITNSLVNGWNSAVNWINNVTASSIPFVPYLTLGSTNTQAAVEELKDELDALVLDGVGLNSVGTAELKPELKTRITNATTSGTYTLDHSAGNDWKLTLTGITTINESNLPTGTDTIEFTMKIFGNFALTLPTYWDVVGDTYSTTGWNFYAVQIHKGDATQEATAFNSNL